jgi:arginyl-tRNA synthetase
LPCSRPPWPDRRRHRFDPYVALERPRDPTHGDIACNIAMQLAKPLKTNPRELATRLVAALQADPKPQGLIASAEIAGPGFINLRLAAAAKQSVARTILQQGASLRPRQWRRRPPRDHRIRLGQPDRPAARRPRPPGRAGRFHVRAVRSPRATRSPASSITTTPACRSPPWQRRCRRAPAASSRATPNGPSRPTTATTSRTSPTTSWRRKPSPPATASRPPPGDVDDIESIRRFAVTYLRNEQDQDLQAFGVKFDNYYLESSLYADGKVAAAVQALVDAGVTYEQDGALWLKTTDYGDDKDRVMRKSDGTFTYFVPDVAYHIQKFKRGFDQAINVQGSDHHGTIARVRAGLQAVNIGIPQGYPDYVLHKMVTVMKNGEEVKISKRAGSYVTCAT